MTPWKGWEVCLDPRAPYKQPVLGMVVVSWDWQEPVSLHGLLSPGLDVCAMDNQQLWRALLGLLQIPRASALPSGTFFPLSLFKTPFGCSTYFHTVSIIPAPPSPPPT